METLPTETIANIIKFLRLDERHVVKRVSRKWQDAADFAIRHEPFLKLAADDYCCSTNSFVLPPLEKRLHRAVKEQRLPDLVGVRYLKVETTKNSIEAAALTAAVLDKVSPTLKHLTVSVLDSTDWESLFRGRSFPELMSFRGRRTSRQFVATLVSAAPRLKSFEIQSASMLSLLPRSTRRLCVEQLARNSLPQHQISRFKHLYHLIIRHTTLDWIIFSAKFPHLRSLRMSPAPCFDDRSIKNISRNCPLLQDMSLTMAGDLRNSLTVASIDCFNTMQSLRVIEIDSSNWTADPSEWMKLKLEKPGGQLKAHFTRTQSPSFRGSLT